MTHDLVSAVLYLHKELRLIHRDLKPGNCLVFLPDKGRPILKICDFGLARDKKRDGTTDFTVKGTIGYMAAEVLIEKLNEVDSIDIDSMSKEGPVGIYARTLIFIFFSLKVINFFL